MSLGSQKSLLAKGEIGITFTARWRHHPSRFRSLSLGSGRDAKRPRISTCPPELSDLPSALSGVPQFSHLLEQTLLVGKKIYIDKVKCQQDIQKLCEMFGVLHFEPMLT